VTINLSRRTPVGYSPEVGSVPPRDPEEHRGEDRSGQNESENGKTPKGSESGLDEEVGVEPSAFERHESDVEERLGTVLRRDRHQRDERNDERQHRVQKEQERPARRLPGYEVRHLLRDVRVPDEKVFRKPDIRPEAGKGEEKLPQRQGISLWTVDEEILVQFTHALTTERLLVALLGPLDRIYSYGVSQTSAVLLETLHGSYGQGLFDLTLVHIALWRPPFDPPGVFEHLSGEYMPVDGVGRVLFVGSEGDQIASDSEQFRRAVGDDAYRVYEVAGAAHQPTPLNPLDHFAVVHAIFTAGDRWVRGGEEPPPSTLIAESSTGDPDSVYGFFTGIDRDGDGNARGGVRLPDLELGRAQYIASDFSLPGLPGILGSSIDLSCEPRPESGSEAPRFSTHGEYVAGVARVARRLEQGGFLLHADAAILVQEAAAAEVGKQKSCNP
jgi:Alpha/beta hydrolase domain